MERTLVTFSRKSSLEGCDYGNPVYLLLCERILAVHRLPDFRVYFTVMYKPSMDFFFQLFGRLSKYHKAPV